MSTLADKHSSNSKASSNKNKKGDTFVRETKDNPPRCHHGCHKHKTPDREDDLLYPGRETAYAMDEIRDSTTYVGPTYGNITNDITNILDAYSARVSQMEERLLQMKSWLRVGVLFMSFFLFFVLWCTYREQ